MTELGIVTVVLALCLSLTGCGPGGGTYCQSGPKYGTQCYSAMDLQPPGSPPPPAGERSRR